MTKLSLISTWINIRKDFFPGWDRAGRWRLSTCRNIGRAQGRCRAEDKVIVVGVLPDTQDALDELLIHETHSLSDDKINRRQFE